MMKALNWLGGQIIRWLTSERPPAGVPQCNFDRLSFEIRPCDVLLVEGRSRVGDVIKTITQSQWTHSALYIGRLHDIEDETTREHVSWLYDGDPNDQLIIEPLLGKGAIVSPLSVYEKDHVRICRPAGLTRADVNKVVGFAVQHLGRDYDVRQSIDLARFLLPYGIVPRRWRSSLFERNVGLPTRTVCSTMIASAFSAVQFPILPVVRRSEDGKIKLYKRNTRLFVPRDFDTSPYFEIIKYPMMGLDDLAVYQQLPWNTEGVVCNDENECFIPGVDGTEPVMVAVPDDGESLSTEPGSLNNKPATQGGS
jgi:Permuted papain-like amidase enzyme, YaeF/YiiX, C92 family